MNKAPKIPDAYLLKKWKELEYHIKIKMNLIDAIERQAVEAVKIAKQQLEEAREAKGISND